MLSAYRISGKIWLVATEKVAQEKAPETLPMGSIVLTVPEAKLLSDQLLAALKDR